MDIDIDIDLDLDIDIDIYACLEIIRLKRRRQSTKPFALHCNDQ